METINSPIKNRVLYTKKTSETIVETADPYTKTIHLLATPKNNNNNINRQNKYDINNRMHVKERLMDKFLLTGLIHWKDLNTVCEWLEYPLCSFELNDAMKTLSFDKNGNVPLESVVEWFLNLEKLTVANIVDGSNDNNSIIPPPPLSNSKNGDPVQLQNYIHELQSSCTAMDGDIAHLELLKKLSFHQMEELKEKLNQSFIKSYELYDEIEEIDQILKKNEKDFGVIVGGTKGLTNVLKGFLVKK